MNLITTKGFLVENKNQLQSINSGTLTIEETQEDDKNSTEKLKQLILKAYNMGY